MIGRTLGHYEITGLVGKGGMGEVYRARDLTLGREVALKILPPDFAEDADRIQRFEREARLLATLNHPNVATIHGFESGADPRFLVMELVEGEDLSRRLARGRVPVEEAIAIAGRIASGVEAAHKSGIVHRDLKPANIKLTGQGLKVLDFGLARASAPSPVEDSVTAAIGATEAGTVVGTAPYMSPEQVRGARVDERSDIWSFGCILFEMLAGESPFQRATAAETMARTLEHDPEFDLLPEHTPPSVRRLLRRCLAKDPEQRLHAIADARLVLEDSLDEPEVPAGGSRGVHALWVAVALVAGIGLGWFLLRPGAHELPSVRTVRLKIPLRELPPLVPTPEMPSVAISPDGRWVSYVGSAYQGAVRTHDTEFGQSQLYLRAIDSFGAHAIRGTDGGIGPFFSPDSAWIGYFDYSDGLLMKISRDGGIAEELCFVDQLTLRGAHWADDGFIYYSQGQGISRVSEDGGPVERIALPDHAAGEKTYRTPWLLPDGHSILFTHATSDIESYDDADIAIWDTRTETFRVIARGGFDPMLLPTGQVVFGRAGQIWALPFDARTNAPTGSATMVLDGVVTSDGYGALQMACSADGTLVYVAGGPEQFASDLVILARDGSAERIPQPPRSYGNVELSPDGTKLLLSVHGANASIWIYDLELGTMTRRIGGWDNFSPVWSPSGLEIFFGHNRAGGNGVSVVRADGSGEDRELISNQSNPYPSSVAPDGESVVVTWLSPGTGVDAYAVTRDGTVTPVLNTPAREVWPRVSPDGRHIAYASDETGEIEIYVQDFPPTGRKWKLSEDGGDLPRWAPDGSSVYFWSGQRLMEVPASTAGSFRPDRAQVVAEVNIEVKGFDVFQDEQHFIVLGRDPQPGQRFSTVARDNVDGRMFTALQPDLHVVLNWFEEVRRLAAVR